MFAPELNAIASAFPKFPELYQLLSRIVANVGVKSVQAGQDKTSGSVATVKNIPITSVNVSKAMVIISYSFPGDAGGFGGYVAARLTSGTNLELTYNTLNGSVQTGTCNWQVVEFS